MLASVVLLIYTFYRSVWFGTLAVYYIMLSVIRSLLLRHVSRNRIGTDVYSEWKHYRLCGIILLQKVFLGGIGIFFTDEIIFIAKKNLAFLEEEY